MQPSDRPTTPVATVLVPAHDEEALLPGTLTALLADARPGELDLLVVANGCTDRSAEVARALGPDVRVVEIPQASKDLALRTGEAMALAPVVVRLDADVVVDTAGLRALLAGLDQPGVLVCAPRRRLDLTGSSPAVRAYYAVWEELSVVREGVFGRGCVALSAAALQRLADRPAVVNDDVFVDRLFPAAQRRVVDEATALVRAPRTVRALVARRARTAAGNSEVRRLLGRSSWRRTVRDLVALAVRGPVPAGCVVVFAAVTVTARLLAARRDTSAVDWGQDRTSRAPTDLREQAADRA